MRIHLWAVVLILHFLIISDVKHICVLFGVKIFKLKTWMVLAEFHLKCF